MQHRCFIHCWLYVLLFLQQINLHKRHFRRCLLEPCGIAPSLQVKISTFVPSKKGKKERFKKKTHQSQSHRIYHKKKWLLILKVWSAVEAWPRPLTSVVCHEMLFWCQSQPLWPLLPQHNTSSTPQPSVQLIHWASTRIPTIHFPWRLSFPLSLPLPLTPSLALCSSRSVSHLLRFHRMEWFRTERHTARQQKISASHYSRPKHFK